MRWNNARVTAEGQSDQYHEPRMCTAEDITQDLYDKGILFICPPNDGQITF